MNKTKQQGATLIEALVSILIMSLGLLGVAGVQLNAIAFQKSSWSTHKVAEVVNDFAERVRSNPTGALNGNYLYTATYSTAKAATFDLTNSCRNGTVGRCSTASIASDDIAGLVDKAQKILPQGAARVEGDLDTGYVITVMFFDRNFTDSSGALQTTASCTGTDTGIDWRNCCPSGAQVTSGVRCRRFTVFP